MSCACLFVGERGCGYASPSVRVHDFCVCPEEETPSSAVTPPSPPENAAVTPFRSPRQTLPSDPGFLSPSPPPSALSLSLFLQLLQGLWICLPPPPKHQSDCPAAGAVRGGSVDLNRTPPGGVDPHTARKVGEGEKNSPVEGGALKPRPLRGSCGGRGWHSQLRWGW